MNNPAHRELTEDQLINMINHNEHSVFKILYEKYWNRLLGFASQYVSDRDVCKEIVQELFITLHVKKGQITINSSLSAYLYSSLRNRIINYMRNESVYKKHIIGASVADTAANTYNNVEQFINFVELQKEISECLTTLPPKCKEVYLVYMQNQCNLAKIAFILNRPLATVEKQFRKATIHLRKHLQNQKL